MAGGTHIPVWTAITDNTLLVRPEGPCTVSICETLEAGLNHLVDSQITHICIDLSRANWLDSTFAGFLVSLVKRFGPSGRRISLLEPSPQARKCLEQMHVINLFALGSCPGMDPSSWQQLPRVDPDERTACDRVLDSHEQLIAADTRNEAEFAPVVQLFRNRAPDASRESG